MASLDALFTRERQAILSGNYAELSRITAAKLALIDRISQSEDAVALDTIREKARRNAKLLEAAARGFRSALSEISDARSANAAGTYSSSGQRNSLSRNASNFEQKA